MDNNGKTDSTNESESSNNGVRFEEGSLGADKSYKEPASSKVIQWVVKYSGGIVKDGKQASYVVLVFVVLVILVSLFLVFGGNGKRVAPLPDPIDPISL